MGACLARDGKPGPCFYGLVTGTIRVSARAVPRSVRAIRFVCDTKVPLFMISREVKVREEVIDAPHGRLPLEWVLPCAAKEGKESPCFKEGAESPSSGSCGFFSGRGLFRSGDGDLSPSDFSRIMLYLHGGAYVLCTPGTLRGVTSPLARSVGAALCVPDYRRPPEYTLAAALEDAMAAYRHVVERFPKADIYLGGESAGGGLAASMLVALRDSELPPPHAVLLMSPWTDLGGEGDKAGLRNASLHNSNIDYLPLDLINMFAGFARGDLPHDSAPASPVCAEGSLAGLPPIFVLYGVNEVLCGQIEHFCEVWRRKGASVRQHGVKGGLHAPLLFHFCHDDSQQSLQELEQFFGGADA